MNGGPVAYIILFGGIALLICFAVFSIKRKVQYLNDGVLIQRNKDFAEYAEIFTLKPVPPDEIMSVMHSEDFVRIMGKKEISGDADRITFKAGTAIETLFIAQLACIKRTEDSMTYRFDFISWKTSYGSPVNADGMNILLTSVEKMFLRFDPNTQVSTVKNETKRH